MKHFFCLLLVLIMPFPAGAGQPSSDYLHNFDLVWQTVNQEHFDPDFGGVDWQESYRSWRPKIAQAQNLAEFTRLTNRMLFELKLSHLMLFSEQDLKNSMPTLFAEGTVGIDLRWSENRAVITKIRPGSSAAVSGLKPGDTLSRIDGRSIEECLHGTDWPPPFNPRNRKNMISNVLKGLLDGTPGSEIRLTVLDARDRRHRLTLRRQARQPGQLISQALPPLHIEFASKRLDDNIGYVWFNHFAPPVARLFAEALSAMETTDGLIIDLRGNPGGYFKTIDRIVAQLIPCETYLYRLQFRDRTVRPLIKPAATVYRQPIAVLVDVTSMSSSELFAACLQALGRAAVVGEQTPGYLLGANWMRLPNGLSFMHPVLLPVPFDGRVVEGNGVVPGIEVGLDRKQLLQGSDSQLEAAREYIRQENQDAVKNSCFTGLLTQLKRPVVTSGQPTLPSALPCD